MPANDGGEVVHQVVVDTQQETGLPLGVDEAVRLLQRLDGGLRGTHIDKHERLLDKAPACQVAIPMLAIEKEIDRFVEKLDRFREASLRHSERSFQVPEDGLIPQCVFGAHGSRIPPGIGGFEAPLGAGEITLHLAGVAETGPGETSELVDPPLFEGVVTWDLVRDMDSKVSQVNGFGGLLRGGLRAPADEQLAKAPAHEAPVGMEAGEALPRIEGKELLQESGRLGTRPGEGGVDRAKDRWEGIGLMKLEQPAPDLSATSADSEQVKEMLVLLRRTIHGEQVLQSGSIEMVVLHAILLWILLERRYGSASR
jgi:hypothetical protein